MKKVILKREVEGLGNLGAQVQVADGYARNYLIPRGLALEATASNIKILEEEQKKEKARYTKEKEEAKKLSERLAKISCTVKKAVGEEGKLFGVVTASDIADVLSASENIKIDKRRITVDETINALGVYTISVKLHPEVTGNLKIWVVKE